MNTRSIFSATMPFVIAKLILGAITVGASLVLGVVFMGLGLLLGESLFMVSLIFWAAITCTISFLLQRYVGYLIKAGHVAVVVEAITTGNVPDNQVEYGKNKVKEKFVSTNAYFVVDSLIAGAVKQIQRGLEKIGSVLDFIPGMSSIMDIAKIFVDIFLNYIDECCLGWSFYNSEQDTFQSSADGIVLYAQNYKKLLGGAVKTMVKAIGLTLLMFIGAFAVLGFIFRVLHMNTFIALFVSVLAASAFKTSIIDSYIMIDVMNTYMQAAMESEIQFDLYEKLCGISNKFKELLDKGECVTRPAYATAGNSSGYNRRESRQAHRNIRTHQDIRNKPQKNIGGSYSNDGDVIDFGDVNSDGDEISFDDWIDEGENKINTKSKRLSDTADDILDFGDEKPKPKARFCGGCGKRLPGGVSFCPLCGHKVDTSRFGL